MSSVTKALSYKGNLHKFLNFLTFPYRSVIMNPYLSGKFLISLRDERFYYVSKITRGRTLDVGCGPFNTFINTYGSKESEGVDFFSYKGLSEENILFESHGKKFSPHSFETITYIASINYIRKDMLTESLHTSVGLLVDNGYIIITKTGFIIGFLSHLADATAVALRFKKGFSLKHVMSEGERHSVSTKEIRLILEQKGMTKQRTQYYWTQWFLNKSLIFKKV